MIFFIVLIFFRAFRIIKNCKNTAVGIEIFSGIFPIPMFHKIVFRNKRKTEVTRHLIFNVVRSRINKFFRVEIVQNIDNANRPPPFFNAVRNQSWNICAGISLELNIIVVNVQINKTFFRKSLHCATDFFTGITCVIIKLKKKIQIRRKTLKLVKAVNQRKSFYDF